MTLAWQQWWLLTEIQPQWDAKSDLLLLHECHQGSTCHHNLVRAEGEAAHTCRVLHPAVRAALPQWWLAAVSGPGKHAGSHWLLHTCRPELHPAGPRLGACGRSPHGAGTSLPTLPSACQRTRSAASMRYDDKWNGEHVPQVVSNKYMQALCT